MKKKFTQENLLSRIDHLEGNSRFVQESLEMALSLGDFHKKMDESNDPKHILQEAAKRIQTIISFEVCAVYLVDEYSSDITLSLCKPASLSQFVEDEIKFMTDKGLFAWAMRERRGVFIQSKDQSRELILHVISTYSKIKGMFIGLLPKTKRRIPDTSTSLLSIVLHNMANAIESLNTYNLMCKRNSKLEVLVEKRTQELFQAEKKLQRAQKLEAIGTLAGGVAHDLNNILAGLVSYPELLLLDIPEGSQLRKPIQTIQKTGQKAADIVQDLLALARRGVTHMEAMNLNNNISEYLKSPEFGKLKINHPRFEVECNFADKLLNIFASPVHISKCVMNLVSNAAEAMPDGGRIKISTQNRYIYKSTKGYEDIPEGNYVIFTISDNGIGISSDDMDRIFEPFYSRKVMGRSGTGLGMSVVWGVIKDHDGHIDVKSIERKGTTFTIYFPVTREKKVRRESPLSLEEYRGRGESILVVDDIAEQRKITKDMLTKLGYSVTAISSGKKAIEYIKNNSADLLVLDMIMEPGLDGLETYKGILKLNPKQKAIIASGFSESDDVKMAQKLGAGVYLKKPYLLEKIGLAVKNELQNHLKKIATDPNGSPWTLNC